jgi:hypothetical protein
MQKVDITGLNFLMVSAISDVVENNPMNRLPVRGMKMALMAASMQGMRPHVDPSKMTDDTKVVWEKDGNRTVMKTRFGWKPMNKKTATTTRSSIVGATGALPVQGVEATVAYDMYHESEKVDQSPIDQIQAENLNNYYLKFIGGQMTLPQLLTEVQRGSLGNTALTVWETAMNGIFPAQADALGAKLMTAVGTNPAFPTAITPTPAQPIVSIAGFGIVSGQTVVNPEMTTALRKMQMKAKTNARPVLIGGDKWLEWHDLQGVMAINTSVGIDNVQYVKRLDHDFYYDENADAIFGTDVALWIEPGSVCEVPWTYSGTKQLPDGEEFKDVHFDKVTASVKQYAPIVAMGYNKNDESVGMDFDLRIARKLDGGDFPRFTFVMNACTGLWARPTNFFTTEVGNPLKTYTGVCAIKIT